MRDHFAGKLLTILLLFCLSATADPLFEQSANNNLLTSPVTFLPVEEAYQLSASYQNQNLILDWQIAPGYYLYQHRFKILDADHKPVTESMTFPPGKTIYDDYYEKELTVYYSGTRLTVPMPSPPSALIIESQGCADAGLCYPPRSQQLNFNASDHTYVVTEASALLPPTVGLPQSGSPNLALMLVFALLGGMILNLMPCVFPILSIKALSLAKAHLGAHNKHLHGAAYTAGIVLSFMAIAALLISLRRAGEAVGWGFQLQSPVFVGLLVYLFVLMGMSFSGLLSFGTRMMNVGQTATQGQSLTATFMTGLLATLVASPCTAPFMGTALGFALAQPNWVAMAIFCALGLGMALPLLALSWWPGLTGRLPRPGPWMEHFKSFLAFPLYLSAVWLLWVLGRQVGSDPVAAIIAGVVMLLFAFWLLGIRKTLLTRTLATLSILTALLLPWQAHLNGEPDDQPWEPYTEARLQQLLSLGDAVFVNLTADWCITCLANEKIALSSPDLFDAFRERQITYLKGDWTNYNPEITQLLNRHHRSGVPLYLFYPANTSDPVILPQLLTKNIVLTSISQKIDK
ncbi:MAG: protein-disulfide reductase DsbD [Gammaproteobacteria bacterium]|nr:MAG: protein-disulfide reductase DsbD [Gammaproteobacteria bacterium]